MVDLPFDLLIFILISFPETLHPNLESLGFSQHFFDHIIQTDGMALHGLFPLLIGGLQLSAQSGHLVLQFVHFLNDFALFMVGFRYLAVHHPSGFLDFFLEFAQFVGKSRQFLFQYLLVGLVVDGHFGFKCTQRLEGCLLGKLQVLGQIAFLLYFALQHLLKLIDLPRQHVPIAFILLQIFPGYNAFHLVDHFVDLHFCLPISIYILLHIFPRTPNSLLNLLQSMHHEVEILMDQVLVLFHLFFYHIDVGFITGLELIVQGLEFVVELGDLVGLLVGGVDQVLQYVFIELVFLVEFLEGLLEHLLDLLFERLHRVVHLGFVCWYRVVR